MSSKTTFTSKCSAVGLGTVWRFPYEVQNNGGSIFLVTYLVCVLLMGIPVMLAEFSLGRGSGSDSVGAFRRLTPGKPWWIIGATAVLASYLILIYYMVVAGWTLEYLWMSITNQLYAGIDTAPNRTAVFSSIMNESLSTGWRPAFWTSVMILLNILVLLRGVKKGIERMSNTLMPLLFVILVVFCCVALSLPNAMEGVDFFLRPDFSKMNPQVLISAVGQAFFSLSLGMGILITYSSYYPKTTKLARTSVTVSGLVFLVAVLMGLIIFPAVKSFGITSDTQGVTLIFVTLPEIFTQMPATQLWSILFFFLLVVAALTSTVSVAEVTIAFLAAKFRMHRKKACYVTLVPLFLLSSICAMSLGPLSHLQILGKTIFDALDYLTSNIMLPVVAIFVCIYVGHVLPKSFLRDEMTNHGTMRSAVMPAILFIIRYIAPLLIAAVLINKLLG